jgi:hypothetical protein
MLACPIAHMATQGKTYLAVTSALGTVSTLLTGGFALVTLRVPLSRGRSTGLALAVGLTLGAALLAILRAAFAGLPGDRGLLDLPWIVACFALEAGLLSTLAALPSVRALFVQREERGGGRLASRASERGHEREHGHWHGHGHNSGCGQGLEQELGERTRDGVVKIEMEVVVENGLMTPGRLVPPTPNRVLIITDEGKRVSRVSEGEWVKMVRCEEERERRMLGRRIVGMGPLKEGKVECGHSDHLAYHMR